MQIRKTLTAIAIVIIILSVMATVVAAELTKPADGPHLATPEEAAIMYIPKCADVKARLLAEQKAKLPEKSGQITITAMVLGRCEE